MIHPMEGREKIRLMAERLLPNGGTLSGLHCPICRGGKSKEASFSITKSADKVLYMCHRNGCLLQGGFALKPPLSPEESDPPRLNKSAAGYPVEPKYDTSKYVFLPLADPTREMLKAQYNLSDELLLVSGWQWERTTNRLCMPMKAFVGPRIGYTLRSFDPNYKPKSIIVRECSFGPTYCVYRCSNNKAGQVLIVEDQISALRASQRIDTIALLGTNLSEGLISKLKTWQYDHVILALDADAFDTALQIQKTYAPLFKAMPVTRLKKDIKDMTGEELFQFFNGIP